MSPADRIDVWKGDITTLDVDAIVNAANESLLGGGGVDGAIHRAAGPELLSACRPLGGCATGQSKITPGFQLTARHVIHTVGPVWNGGAAGEPGLLRSCYRTALHLAATHEVRTIAFPGISTGVYGYPKAKAAEIAADVVVSWLLEHALPNKVTLCTFDDAATTLARDALTARLQG